MTDDKTNSLTVAPSRRATQAANAKPSAIGRKLKAAIADMIENGTAWNDAATNAGLTVQAMRISLKKPHVLQYVKAEREVFRAAICTGNIFKLAAIRDQDSNQMAALGAIKQLEQIGDEPGSNSGANVPPGLVIQIINAAPLISDQKHIELIPLNSQVDVPNE